MCRSRWKRNSLRLIVSAALGLALLPSAVPAQAQTQYLREFSADFVSNLGGHESTSRFFAAKTKTRMEVLQKGNVIGITIMDYGNNTGWNLNPQQKTAMDMSSAMKWAQQVVKNEVLTGLPPDPNNPCAALRGASCRKLGSEDVNGRHTQKWEVTDKDGKSETVWIDPSLPLAIKTQWANGGWGEFRNIKETSQPDSLFQVPSDYRKVPFPLTLRPPTTAKEQ